MSASSIRMSLSPIVPNSNFVSAMMMPRSLAATAENVERAWDMISAERGGGAGSYAFVCRVY